MPDVPTPIPRSVVQVPPADTPGVQGLLTLAVAVVIVAGLYLGREVMIPIILAVLLSFLLAPVANFLRRLHLGRVPSALLAVVLALGIILMFGTVIGSQLADLAQEVPRYASSVERKVETLQSHTLGRITTIMRSLGHELDRASTPENASSGAATPSASPGEERKSIPVEVHEPQPSSVQLAQRIISVDQHEAAQFCRAVLINERQGVRHSIGPSEEHGVVKIEMFKKFADVLRVALQRVSVGGLLRISLGTRIQRNHAKSLGKFIDLRFEDIGRHGPARDQHESRAGSRVEVMERHAVAGAEGRARGSNLRLRDRGNGGERQDAGEVAQSRVCHC